MRRDPTQVADHSSDRVHCDRRQTPEQDGTHPSGRRVGRYMNCPPRKLGVGKGGKVGNRHRPPPPFPPLGEGVWVGHLTTSRYRWLVIERSKISGPSSRLIR